MSTRQNLLKAIEDGKVWMSQSRDDRHDVKHVQAVEDMALAIYKELQEDNYPGIETISPELISVTVWWHDCYKASLEHFSSHANFNEGVYSDYMARGQLKDLLTPNDLDMVCEAIRYHAGISLAPYFWKARSKSVLHKILLEADAHDMIRSDRVYGGFKKGTSIIERLWVIIDLLQTPILFIYLRTKVARKDLWKRFWKYWGVMFWKDWYFFKIMFNKL